MQEAKHPYRITSRPIITGCFFVWTAWLILMYTGNHWHYFSSEWFMSITMVFGSFIAGATSEGGGAVAFPVMTLVFNIEPYIARDFSLMIQSVGMTAAAFTIYCLKIPVEWRAIYYASLGGAIGMIFGLEKIYPFIQPAFAKVFFTSVWLSFGIALYLINLFQKREIFTSIPSFHYRHAILLFCMGIIGGIISSIVGSGLDLLIFSILVLGFRLNPKIATPTSVILMGFNALIGFFWKGCFSTVSIAPDAWHYWYVCIPIVVVGAPMGAWFIKNRSRQFIVRFLYCSIIAQYIGALIIIPQTYHLMLFNITTVLIGTLFFYQVARAGIKRIDHVYPNKSDKLVLLAD